MTRNPRNGITYDEMSLRCRACGSAQPDYCWTTNVYDELSRIKQVILPDNQTVTTTYNGSTVTVTDQVGRQNRSQVDGLGRLITATEQDPASGELTLTTSYSYNVLEKLTQVSQGGQTRAYKY